MQHEHLKKPTHTVFIVDDDPAVRDAIRWLMEQVKLKTHVFSSADEFFASYTQRARGCLILDIRMPGMSGLELQERLNAIGAHIPIIIITGHGDISVAVRAMKAGAFEFLQKPFNDQLLLDTVQSALAKYGTVWEQETLREKRSKSLASLTKRELDVLRLMQAGKPNKVIASILKISVRTVEGHRASIMSKTGSRSLGELFGTLYSNS